MIAEYGYDELSRRTLLTLGNDANAIYEYDLGNRLTKLTNNIDDINSITFEYASYDNVGNRLSMKIDDANSHVYAYDNLYQLTAVDYNDGNSTSYAYDVMGNRIDVNTNGTVVDYNSNGLNQYDDVNNVNFSYDDNGNLTDDGLFKYYYDCENRLTEVNDINDVSVATYEYDYLGRRVRKTVYGSPDVITQYCYNGAQVIAEYNGSDTLLRKFVYGPGIDEPVCMIDVADNNKIYYYHFDGLGSVAALSEENADVVERYSYNVFGEPNRTSSVNNPYMFTARRYDDETSLYYYRARYYDPDVGRFISVDPIGYEDSMNLYNYVGNNPVVERDPFGQKKGKNKRNDPQPRTAAKYRRPEKPEKNEDCMVGCGRVHKSMILPNGCPKKCCDLGSVGVSACLMAAKKGNEACVTACLLSDNMADPKPPEAFEKGRDAAFKVCAN
ncbi:MAG: RHS repeat domain-containing protein [Planctomycetota bacterium]